MMLNPDDNGGEYVRLRQDSLAGSLDTPVAVSASQSAGINLPTNAPIVHYAPKRSGKYREAWRSLIPFRKTKRREYEIPLDKLGLFSYIASTWMSPLLRKSWNPSLIEQDVITGSPSDSSDINGQRFKLLLSDEIVKSGLLNASICKVVWVFMRTRIILASVLSLLGSIFSIIGLVLLLQPEFLTFRDQTEERKNAVWISPLIFIIAQFVSVFLQSWSNNITQRTAVRVRCGFLTVMYRHLVQVSVLSSISVQQIVSVMATDSQRLFYAVSCVPAVITAVAIFIVCSIIIIWSYIGSLLQSPPCKIEHLRMIIANIAASFTVFTLLYMLAKAASVFKSRATNVGADRLNKLHEMLSHIRLVKMTSWEKFFTSKVKDFHKRECSFIRKAHTIEGLGDSLYNAVPVITALVVCSINVANAVFITTLILLLGPMKDSLYKYWTGISGISAAQQSLERLRCILRLEKSKQSTERPMNRLVAVAVSNASFVLKPSIAHRQNEHENCLICSVCPLRSYELEIDEELELQDKALLTNISFSVPKGKLIGICGARGSGKTTLLLAILGHLNMGYHRVFRDGMFSYVSQNPWIWNATLRDNILLNAVFNHQRYYQAIHCCSLNEDIQQLPGGDQTKLHSRSLSLEQRQRVAVARALYAFRDICLFDDFLSAVNKKLAVEIFNRTILTHLKDKTVIITSRHEEFLSHCDEIYLLVKGEVYAHGLYEEVKSVAEEHFANMLEDSEEELHGSSSLDLKHFTSLSSNLERVPSVMVEDEDKEQEDSRQMEKFTSSTLMAYIMKTQTLTRMITSSMLRTLFVILVFVSALGCAFMYNDSSEADITSSMYWIPSVILLMFITCLTGIIIFCKVLEKVALIIHDTWLEKICQTSIAFFEETSMSDIMKWFSAYIQNVDVDLPSETVDTIQQFTFVLLAVLIIILLSLWFLLPLIITAVLCVIFYITVKPGLIKIQSMEEESSNPLYAFVSSTLTGRATIQAYGKESDYLSMFTRQCDVNTACIQLISGAISWFSFRIQLISALPATLILILLLAARMFHFQDLLFAPSPFENTESIVGITMLCALVLGNALHYAMLSILKIKAKLLVVGQMEDRIRNIESMKYHSQQNNLPAQWPVDGSIVFRNVKVKTWSYTSSAPNGMTFIIQPKEKVGILGTELHNIIDILFRLEDLSQGSVYIGGTDISTVPFEKLRSSITLIPQSPVFFSGSIRQNMDPDRLCTEIKLQESLEKVSIWDVVKTLPGKLDAKVELLQDKLSGYELQLIYIARALLKDPKVLIIEEPYSSKDMAIQRKIHTVVKKLFKSSTILILAHHVLSVLDCQRVIVIKDGQLVESGTPQHLFKNSNSKFSKMLTASTNDLFETAL